MYKLIASDLDGTLLRTDKTISQETIDTLVKLDKKGILFAPSTGRTHLELPEPIAKLPFLKYGLCVNGGEIYDYQKDCCVYELNISNEEAIAVLEYAKQLPIVPSMVIHGKRYMPCDDKGNIDAYIQSIAVKSILAISIGIPNLIEFLKENKEGVQKFLMYPRNAQQKEEMIQALSKQFPNLSICSSGPLYIEVNANGVDKGKGLQKLCEYIGIETKDVIAFGDASNDIALLKEAGLAVVMENGTEETKKYAHRLAKTNDEDGLRKVLEEIYSL